MFREYERDFRWLLHEVGHLYNYSLYNVSFSRLTLTHLYFYFVWEIQKKTDNNQSLSSMSRDFKALFEFVQRIPLLLLLQSGEDRLGNSFFLQKDLIQMQYDSLCYYFLFFIKLEGYYKIKLLHRVTKCLIISIPR